MKKFTQLALVSSLAISANAMAMQAMDDAALSASTGQDGISIGIGISKIEIEKLLIHDNDGLSPTAGDKAVVYDTDGTTVLTPAYTANLGGTGKAGAIVIKGNGQSVIVDNKETNLVKDKGLVIGANYDNNGAYLLTTRNLADLRIDSDAGTGGKGAFLNIAADVSGLDIHIGEIGVAASNAVPDSSTATSIRRGASDTNYNAILSGLSLKTGKMSANIQLGAAPQGAMIKLASSMIGGLEITHLGILDNSTNGALVGQIPGTTPTNVNTKEAGEIHIDSIKVADANSTNLTLNATVSVYNDGYAGSNKATDGFLKIQSSSGPIDTYVKGIHLGNKGSGSIGDVEVQGLQTYWSPAQGVYNAGSVIKISGR